MIEYTKRELKAEIRQELKCPREFIVHLDFWKTFDELKEAILSGNRDERDEIMDQIRDGYRDYCSDTGLDPMKNNRRKTPGYFLYTMGGNHA